MPVLLALAAVLVVTFTAFAGSFGHDFVSLDDATYVTQNPLVQSRDYGALATSVVNNSYHPLTMISLAMNASRPLSPRPFLATNVALHLANTALVFWLAFLLSRRRVLAAVVAALLFGIHPMRVESVAWVSSRKDVLYGFFFLGGLLAYWRYLEQRARARSWLVASFALFVASCLAKGMAVVFPLLLPWLDFWKGRRVVERGAILEKVPFLAVSLLFGLIALDAEAGRDFHGLLTIVDRQLVATMDTSGFTPLLRVALPAYGFSMYACRLVAPVGLGALYPYPTAAEAGSPVYTLSILLLLAALVLAAWSVRRARTLAFGLGWFLIAIFPVLQWVPIGASMLADRMTYIAYVGPFLALGIGADAIARRSAAVRVATWSAVGVAAAVLCSMTAAQTRTWRNSDALWSQVIRNHPTNDRPYVSRGNARGEAGDLAGAMDDFRTALRLGARGAGVYDGLGTAYGALGNADSALAMYDRALAADPSLGRTYANRAIIHLRRGEPRPALADLDRAAALLPLLSPSLEFPRGNAYLQLGMLSEAEASYTRAIEANLSVTDALQNRGVCRLRRGDSAGARADFERALRIDPDYVPAREQLRAMAR